MAGSHTSTSADYAHVEPTPKSSPLQLVSTADRGLSGLLTEAVDGHLATFAEHVREGLLAASTAVGPEVLAELMEAEVTDLAGPKGRHDAQRSHTRHGGEDGSVTLGDPGDRTLRFVAVRTARPPGASSREWVVPFDR